MIFTTESLRLALNSGPVSSKPSTLTIHYNGATKWNTIHATKTHQQGSQLHYHHHSFFETPLLTGIQGLRSILNEKEKWILVLIALKKKVEFRGFKWTWFWRFFQNKPWNREIFFPRKYLTKYFEKKTNWIMVILYHP